MAYSSQVVKSVWYLMIHKDVVELISIIKYIYVREN